MNSLSTVDHAVDLLLQLGATSTPQGVTTLSKALGLGKSSTHRLLVSLTRRGLVEQDERRCYRTGPALVALGLAHLEQDPVVAAARPELQAAAVELGETVFLAGPRAGRILVLDQAQGAGFLRAAPRIGEVIPVHATAIGKLVLALAPDAVALGESELEAFTERTATSHAALEIEIRRARLRGWAENRGEWIPGMSVVAVPLWRREQLEGALAVAAASEQIERLGVLPLVRRLRRAAARIEERLAGTRMLREVEA
ncbi:MAG: IclR family transcriptional regulator [bacterium]|nr:IclR family transcriptional regulator [bacterium]